MTANTSAITETAPYPAQSILLSLHNLMHRCWDLLQLR